VPFDPKTAQPLESVFDPSTARLFEPEEFEPYSPTISPESFQPIDVQPVSTDVEKLLSAQNNIADKLTKIKVYDPEGGEIEYSTIQLNSDGSWTDLKGKFLDVLSYEPKTGESFGSPRLKARLDAEAKGYRRVDADDLKSGFLIQEAISPTFFETLGESQDPFGRPEFGKGLKIRDVFAVLKEVKENWKKYIPYLGSAVEAWELIPILSIARKLESGEDVSEEELYELYDWHDEQAMDEETTFFGGALDILLQVPAFAVELGVAKGITGVAIKGTKYLLKKVLNKGYKKTIQKALADKVKTKVAVKTIATTIAGAEIGQRIEADTARRQLNKVGMTEQGNFIFNEGFNDENRSRLNARLNNYVEVFTEQLGGEFGRTMFGPILKTLSESKLGAKLTSEILEKSYIKAFLKFNKNADKTVIAKAMRAGGVDGILAEFLEERAGSLIRGTMEVALPNIDEDFAFQYPSLEQWAQEIVAFSILPGAKTAFGAKGEFEYQKSKVGKEILKARESGEFDEVTVDVAENFARQNPKAFEKKSILNFIEETRTITREQKRSEGWTEERIDEFFVGEGLEAGTERASVLGSTLEENGKVLINLYKGARPDTVIEEFYGNSYRNLSAEEKSVFSQFYTESGSTLTEQEFFEKEGVKHYLNEKLYENSTVQKIYKKLKQFFNEKILGNTTLDPKIRKMWEDAGYAKVGEGTTSKDETFQLNEENFVAKIDKDIARTQRGKPENIMEELQNDGHSNIFGWGAEHIGDLINRMTSKSQANRGEGAVEEKVNKLLNNLKNPYGFSQTDAQLGKGFEKEHLEQLSTNAKLRNISLDEAKEVTDKLGLAYSDAHSELPTYNNLQQLAQESSVAYGKQDFATAISKIEDIKKIIDEGRYQDEVHKIGKDESFELVEHYSNVEGIETLDPDKFGTGKANKQERQEDLKRTYFYAKGETPESIFRNHKYKYTADLDEENYYDIDKDQLGLTEKASWESMPGYKILSQYRLDELIKDAGFDGFTGKVGLGKRAYVKFTPTPVLNIQNLRENEETSESYSLDTAPNEVNTKLHIELAKYAKSKGYNYTESKYAELDIDRAKAIADAFDNLKSDLNNPEVKSAYTAMANETKEQWDLLESLGYKMEPWDGVGQPYDSSKDMIADVMNNKHLYFFPTEKGFGDGADVTGHPLLENTGITINNHELVYNDLFRAVHDIIGHSRGNQFGPRGEENAWREHSQIYSPEANKALTTETRGQNSWVNFGKHLRDKEGNILGKNDKGFLPQVERPYAEQKVGILPEEFRESYSLVSEVAEKVKGKKVRKGGEVRAGFIQGLSNILETLSDPKFDFEGSFEWYRTKVKNSIDVTSIEVPEIAESKTTESIFKILLGITSHATEVNPNYHIAVAGIKNYLKTGKFEIAKNSTGKDVFVSLNKNDKRIIVGTTKSPVVGKNVLKLQKLIDEKGETGAVDWLMSQHTGREIEGMFGDKYSHLKKDFEYYGAMAFGPKIGRYIMNLQGVHEEAVYDVWWSRAWNRWMGTPFQTFADGTIKRNPKNNRKLLQEVPRGNPERALMDEVVNALTVELKEITGHEWGPDQVQAVLWYYEKELYIREGSAQKEGTNYFEVAKERAKERGYYNATTPKNIEGTGRVERVGSSLQGEPTQDTKSPQEKTSKTRKRDGKKDTQEVTPSDESFSIQAFHGSPYKFDQFDSSKIGTGEGNQAFGHGLYFSSKEEIGKFYVDQAEQRQKPPSDPVKRKEYNAITEEIKKIHKEISSSRGVPLGHEGFTNYVVLLNKQQELLDKRDKLSELHEKTLYNVTLHKGKDPSEYNYMSWVDEVPVRYLGKLQKEYEYVMEANADLLKSGSGTRVDPNFFKSLQVARFRGMELYRAIQGNLELLGYGQYAPKATSDLFLSAGIDGIRFPAQGGTGGRFGDTENFVVFDDKAVTIDKQESFQLSPQQQEYFKDTKVAFQIGLPDQKPMVMYHSTDKDFTEFAKGDIGYHFGTIEASEDNFTRKSMIVSSDEIRQNWRTIPVYLDIKNPLRMRDIGKWDNAFEVHKELIVEHKDDLGSTKFPNPNSVPYEKRFEVMRNHLESLGYDGIVYGNLHEGNVPRWTDEEDTFMEGTPKYNELVDSYIAFNPEQIKSVWNTDPASTGESFQLGTVTDESTIEYLERKLINKLNRLQKYQDEIETLPEDENAIQVAETMHGVVRHEIDEIENQLFIGPESLISRAKKSGFSVDDLGEYLYARHAIERNNAMQEKNSKLITGSGMTNAEANKIIKKYRGKGIHKYANEIWRDITNKALQMKFDAGLIDKPTLDRLKKEYKHYVPLKGLLEEDGFTYSSGQGFSTTSTGIFTAYGRESKASNPLIQAMIDLENTVYVIEKNKVGQAFLRMMQNNESKSWKVTKRKFKPVYDENGEVDFKPRDLADDEVQVFLDGDRYVIKIKDKTLLKNLKQLNQVAPSRAMKYLTTFNTFFRAVNTNFNPEFIITNFMRDMQTALIHLSIDQKKDIRRAVVGNIKNAMGGIRSQIRGDGSHEWAQLYDEFKAHGGKAGWMDFKDISETLGQIEKELEKAKNGESFLQATGKLINDYNEVVENGVRLATYKALTDSGMSKKKSAHYAKDLTVNFNRKGEWGTVMNTLYVFSNAGMQGSNKIWRMLKHKKGRKIAMQMVAFGFLQSLFNRWMDEEEWDQFDEYVKDNYFNLMLPNGKTVSIKMPYGWNTFFALGGTIEQFINADTSFGDLLSRTVKNAVDGFAPLSGGSLAQFITPTFLTPIVQIDENKTFFGGDISKDKEYHGKTLPEHKRGFPSVNPIIKGATQGLYDYTGLDIPYLSNPEFVEHIIESYTGGAGKFVVNSFTASKLAIFDGVLPPAKKIPIARQIVKSKSEYRSYQRAKALLAKSEIKKLDKEQMRKYLNEAKLTGYKNKTLEKMWKQFNTNQRKFR